MNNKAASEALVACGMFVEIQPIKDGRRIAYYIGFPDEYNGTRDFRKSVRIDPLTNEDQRQALLEWFHIVVDYINGQWICESDTYKTSAADTRKAAENMCLEACFEGNNDGTNK